MTVLVVEDQSTLAEPLQDQLEAAGHSCLTACDTDDADWMLETVRVDVLVVDLDLPTGTALEWLEGLCLDGPALTASTVAITGRSLDEEQLARIWALGASVLSKPFPIQELHDAVLSRVRDKRKEPAVPPEGGGPSRPPTTSPDERGEA